MTTLQINTNDITAIEEIKKLVKQKFHFEVKIISNHKIENNTKWAKVADEIRETMSDSTSKYLQECSKEIRSGFELRDLTTSQ